MDAYEATNIVMSRIQGLDPENASKIMGYILIQDQGEKEMIRLAFCPEALLLSYIHQAKACLGLPSNRPSSKPLNPLSNSARPNSFFPKTSPRILIPNNGFHHSTPRSSPRPISYAAVLNGSSSATTNGGTNDSRPSSLHFYGGNDFSDEFLSGGLQHQELDPIMSPSGRSDSLIFPYGEDANSIPSPHPHPFHRRSFSVNDAVFLSNLEEGGGGGGGGTGFRPCMYFAKGFCKNGSACKFLHSDIVGDEAIEVGSPSSNASGFDEFLRMKALQQQRFALMASGGHHPFSYNNQRCGPRNGFSSMGLGAAMTSSSRQIYLTFPADSTFKEENVSSYFSMFGPVQDVRIPYQQKRMFGFVTFAYPETVKLILAKGNPHYVCDSRVLVKPYKEKGKVADKKQLQQQHQHLERWECSPCLSPSGIDSKELFDLPMGSRMPFDTQQMMLRRKLEQEAGLQHSIELQGRRMMNLQLMDLKYQQHNHQILPSLPAVVSISSPRQSELLMSENVIASSDASNQDVLQEFDDAQERSKSSAVTVGEKKLVLEVTESSSNNNVFGGHKHQHVNDDNFYLPESLEHILPDNLFASPTKSVAEHQSIFPHASAEASNPLTNTSSNNLPVLPSSSPLGMASVCFSQMTRLKATEI